MTMVRAFLNRKSNTAASVSTEQCISEKAKEVLLIVRRKGPPLTAKQLDFCNEACIRRFLKAKNNNVKKAAKQLRETLIWRAYLDVDYLTADEFCAELAAGTAYVAGQDDDGRPVVVVKLKPENLTHHAHKQFLRYFVFTMEVAISCMSSGVEQCILIIDVGCCNVRKGSHVGISMVSQLLKIVGEHYPERLSRSFIFDASFMFYYLWKGVGKFMDVKMREKPKFVFSRNYAPLPTRGTTTSRVDIATKSFSSRNLWLGESDDEDKIEYQEDDTFEFNSPIVTNSLPTTTNSCNSSTPSSSSSSFSHMSLGAALMADRAHARSLSFASTLTSKKEETTEFRSFRVDTKPSRVLHDEGGSRRWMHLTFGHKRDDAPNHQEHLELQTNYRNKDDNLFIFKPYYTSFLSIPYNEASYRARMKPPLAGLISILSQEFNFKQPEFSLHNTTMEAMLHQLHFV